MFTKLFVKDMAERAISTFAQAVVAMTSVLAPATGMDLLKVDYGPVIMVGVVAALLSVLKAIIASSKAGTDTASLVVDNKELKK